MATKLAQPQVPVTRTRMATFYLTEEHYRSLKTLAAAGGFKSTSHLVTAIIEPLLQGDLSIMSFIRSATRLQKFMKSNGAQFSLDRSSIRELPLFGSPPPPIPDETISVQQLRKDLEQVLKVLEREERANTKHQKQPA